METLEDESDSRAGSQSLSGSVWQEIIDDASRKPEPAGVSGQGERIDAAYAWSRAFSPKPGGAGLLSAGWASVFDNPAYRDFVVYKPHAAPVPEVPAGRDRSYPAADGSDNESGRFDRRAGDRLGFPERRPGWHPTGSEFMRDVLGASGPRSIGLTGPERERAILAQVEAGNIPEFLRQPKTVVVEDGRGNRAELKVMPDYLAIGTDDDFVRVPVTPLLAKALADKYGMALPTKKVVDAVYEQAAVRLAARGLVMNASDQSYMQGNGFYMQHDRLIDRDLGAAPHDQLVAGHKKDIIISRFAEMNPSRLDFYGFFAGSGRPIQGAHGGAHENTYVDYSHGVRFLSQEVIVNGRPMSYADVLADPRLCWILSDDGAVNSDRVYKRPIDRSYNSVTFI